MHHKSGSEFRLLLFWLSLLCSAFSQKSGDHGWSASVGFTVVSILSVSPSCPVSRRRGCSDPRSKPLAQPSRSSHCWSCWAWRTSARLLRMVSSVAYGLVKEQLHSHSETRSTQGGKKLQNSVVKIIIVVIINVPLWAGYILPHHNTDNKSRLH